jgi:3-dehydroquinate dehydratase
MGHLSEIAQLLVGISLLGNMLVTLLNFMQSRHNGKQIDAVHEATNSMKDALVASTAKASFAEGVKHGEDNPR